jgi:hypothetical protein
VKHHPVAILEYDLFLPAVRLKRSGSLYCRKIIIEGVANPERSMATITVSGYKFVAAVMYKYTGSAGFLLFFI